MIPRFLMKHHDFLDPPGQRHVLCVFRSAQQRDLGPARHHASFSICWGVDEDRGRSPSSRIRYVTLKTVRSSKFALSVSVGPDAHFDFGLHFGR